MNDHDIMIITTDIKTKLTDHSPRNFLYHKTNWNAIRENFYALATDVP